MDESIDTLLEDLFAIYRSSPYGSEEEASALRAIGRVGTQKAIDFLSGILEVTRDEEDSFVVQTRIMVIEALVEAKRRDKG